MEITVEQLRELIFDEEQKREVAQAQSDRLDYEASVELMKRVMEAFPIQTEEREQVSRLDRILYTVRGAYIIGYMSAVDTLNDAMRAFVADFIGGGVHSSPNSLQADTEPCRAQRGKHSDSLWDMISLLSFIYDTGRVQGIREERAKRKERYNKNK